MESLICYNALTLTICYNALTLTINELKKYILQNEIIHQCTEHQTLYIAYYIQCTWYPDYSIVVMDQWEFVLLVWL